MSCKRNLLWVAMLWAGSAGGHSHAATLPATAAATTTVRGRVEVMGTGAVGKKRHEKLPGTVVWLTPISPGTGPTTSMTPEGGEASGSAADSAANPSASTAQIPRLVQKHKSFEPHILVVQAGSWVEFPNRDPFFHNVFSLFEGKRFDLGLYEAGTSQRVRFDRTGISYIFCNIHPEMSAVVITLATPLYAISTADGQLSLTGVPYGRYMLHIWSEGMGPEYSQPLTREITIAVNASSLGVIRVPEANGERMAHKNKYGRDYDAPTPNSTIYEQQR